MSDFGILLVATKKNGTSISSSEIASLSNELENLIKNGDCTDMLGELFQHEFDSSNGPEVLVQLSEHYFGDEDPDESMEFVEENELDDAKELATKMSQLFSDFTFKATIEAW